VLELGEHQVDTLRVQLDVEIEQYVRGGGVHVGDRFGRDDNPPRLGFG
jgi:hypothetical protein